MRKRAWPERLGLGLLLLQLGWIVTCPWHRERTLAWAPLHETAWFRVEASVGGRRLTSGEVADRYGVRGWFWRSASDESWQLNEMHRVLGIIADTEIARPEDRAQVQVWTRRNGRPQEVWQWPR